ncbi:MAG: cell wall hydrolase [Thiohalospira sp.]
MPFPFHLGGAGFTLGAGLLWVLAGMDSPASPGESGTAIRPELPKPDARSYGPEPISLPAGVIRRGSGLSWEARVRPLSRTERECLARNAFFEARGESVAGQVAVTMVVLNRLRAPRFPDEACQVIRDGAQFSWVDDGRPNDPRAYPAPADRRAWRRARRVVAQVLGGAVRDPTAGSDHYHARGVQPGWSGGMALRTALGGHLFYASGEASRP